MGLDAVELLMDVEETFGVAIPDEVAQNIRTVGELYDYLLTQCTTDRQAACPSSAAFYIVRQGICQTLRVERNHIRPAKRIDEFVSRFEYPRFWARLQRSMVSLRLPSLGRPSWLSHLVVYSRGYAMLFALASIVVWTFAAAQIGVLVFPIVALEVALIIAWLASAAMIAGCLPRNFQTVGELARLIAKGNPKWFLARQETWNEARIWEVLQSTVSKTLGVELANVTRQARFVEDLGL